MSTDTAAAHVPQFDLADRLRKALRVGDVAVQDMADYLEVSRNTVGRWINGHNEPSGAVVRLWALRTGVPYAWLRDGTTEPRPDGPDGALVEYTARDLNPEPAGSEPAEPAAVVPLFRRVREDDDAEQQAA